MILENEMIFLFSHAMPVTFWAVSLYVVFAATVCTVSRVFPRIESWFASTTSKTLPFFLIVILIESVRR